MWSVVGMDGLTKAHWRCTKELPSCCTRASCSSTKANCCLGTGLSSEHHFSGISQTSYIHFGHQGIAKFWRRAIQLVLWPFIASAVSLLLTGTQQGTHTSRLQGKLAKQNGTCSICQRAVVNSTSVAQKVQNLCLILYSSWSPNKTAFSSTGLY